MEGGVNVDGWSLQFCKDVCVRPYRSRVALNRAHKLIKVLAYARHCLQSKAEAKREGDC